MVPRSTPTSLVLVLRSRVGKRPERLRAKSERLLHAMAPHPFRFFPRNGWEGANPPREHNERLPHQQVPAYAAPQVPVPEGQEENSPGWSEAKPWESLP
jgi:hypothetical protein